VLGPFRKGAGGGMIRGGDGGEEDLRGGGDEGRRGGEDGRRAAGAAPDGPDAAVDGDGAARAAAGAAEAGAADAEEVDDTRLHVDDSRVPRETRLHDCARPAPAAAAAAARAIEGMPTGMGNEDEERRWVTSDEKMYFTREWPRAPLPSSPHHASQ
jgi:hypothetical protein